MDHVSWVIEGHLARLRLTRPDRRNAITSAMLDDVVAACREISESDADVVVFSAEGPSFSVGFDLDEIAAGNTPDGAYAGSRAIEALLDLPAITIAAVGWLAGARRSLPPVT
jgi:enoyl-CoA hydratase/carnithine racemase